ncbi:hypothetical protein C0J52_04408 [Blattella germanica]|nr:hypothetical protein C0J52_04408 [Blattella germanica]
MENVYVKERFQDYNKKEERTMCRLSYKINSLCQSGVTTAYNNLVCFEMSVSHEIVQIIAFTGPNSLALLAGLHGQSLFTTTTTDLRRVEPDSYCFNISTKDMLTRVWQEFGYQCDIVRVAGGGDIEHL